MSFLVSGFMVLLGSKHQSLWANSDNIKLSTLICLQAFKRSMKTDLEARQYWVWLLLCMDELLIAYIFMTNELYLLMKIIWYSDSAKSDCVDIFALSKISI